MSKISGRNREAKASAIKNFKKKNIMPIKNEVNKPVASIFRISSQLPRQNLGQPIPYFYLIIFGRFLLFVPTDNPA
jgi:hypothetical protein